ncbi:hypothetical protein TNCV_2955211 [Trichonephila clavipes]|nr:hypothetical protein TNCV_2955211 [Trichonephila clavipes]
MNCNQAWPIYHWTVRTDDLFPTEHILDVMRWCLQPSRNVDGSAQQLEQIGTKFPLRLLTACIESRSRPTSY